MTAALTGRQSGRCCSHSLSRCRCSLHRTINSRLHYYLSTTLLYTPLFSSHKFLRLDRMSHHVACASWQHTSWQHSVIAVYDAQLGYTAHYNHVFAEDNVSCE